MRSLLILLPVCGAALLLSHSAETRPAGAPVRPADPAAGSYVIDSGHSGALFRVKHVGVSNFWGRFNHVSGSFELAEDAAKCSVQVTIEAASVDTNSEGRDKHVKGPDFFNVKEYPRITFVSQKVRVDGDDYHVTGDLTLVGETREVTIPMTKIGEASTRMGDKCGFEGEFTFDRKDFGMSALAGALGTEIRCVLFIEANKE